MIGSGLKKLADENGMRIFDGVAYGCLRGYAVTLSEGAAYQKVDFSVMFPNAADRDALKAHIAGCGLRSKYLVQNISFGSKSIQVTFRDSLRPMKHIRAFLDFFLPLLKEFGATGAEICAECGEPLADGVWVQINGICHPMHETCAESVRAAMGADREQQVTVNHGSHITGTLGALVGAALGAVIWALVLNAGFMAALIGLCIGWLAERGYTLAKGKQGRGKPWILACVVALAVVLGTFGADAIEIAKLMVDGLLPGFGFGEIPMFLLALLVDNGDYRLELIYNLGMGLLFAGLGVFAMIAQSARNVSGSRFRYMK